MEENTIVCGEKVKPYKFLIISVIPFLTVLFLYIVNAFECRSGWERYDRHSSNPSFFRRILPGTIIPIIFWISLLLFIIAVIIYLSYRKVSITVTDKRVYGTAAWGKRVDLPLDSVSAVGTGMLNGISVATSSGAIKFVFIKNKKEVHSAISELLLERQKKQPSVIETTVNQKKQHSDADELKKYKDLLDSGVITQEEFDAKKKQILGL